MPMQFTLEAPEHLLSWIAEAHQRLDLDDLDGIDIHGLVALAALVRGPTDPSPTISYGKSEASRFARDVGFGEPTNGAAAPPRAQPRRTVTLQTLQTFPQVEPTASQIVGLLLQGEEQQEVRRTIHYVLVELLRNVVQHSRAPRAGIVAAQVMEEGPYAGSPAIQIAVADCGIGIPASLSDLYPDLASAEEALDKARWPYVSGTFRNGLTGSRQNAGMGLFFISEMAKLTASRLLIATRGASVFLWGDPADVDSHSERYLRPDGLGYPGTLVAFELPFDTAATDYDGLIKVITDRAKERTPQRAVKGWFQFDREPPANAQRFVVHVAAEDTVAAESWAQDALQPAVLKGRPIVLNFANVKAATQSYLHSLLFEVVRLAWAKRVPIHVVNARPAVQSSLELLEQYALGG